MPETDVRIRLLERSDDRSDFRSGNIDLDRYLQRYAGQNQFRHHLGTTYVAIAAQRVCGFVTITPGELTADSIPKSVRARLPGYPLPILRISRLAVDERDQGKGIGRLLLRAMFGLALDLRDRFSCMGVVVDAKSGAVGFYESLGFMKLDVTSGNLGDRPEPVPMFLSVKDCESRGQVTPRMDPTDVSWAATLNRLSIFSLYGNTRARWPALLGSWFLGHGLSPRWMPRRQGVRRGY